MADCHRMALSGDVDLAMPSMTAEPSDPADCCADGQCDCACTHAPALPIIVMSIPRLAPPSAPALAFAVAPVAESHGSPFRPPIA